MTLLIASILTLSSPTIAADSCPKAQEMQLKDLEKLTVKNLFPTLNEKEENLKLSGNKVRAVRIFATWCPHCKKDLENLGQLYESLPNKKDFELILIANNNRKETLESAKTWTETYMKDFKIPKEQVRVLFTTTEMPALKELKLKSGQATLPEIMGFPYGMIFDRKGKARVRGHFEEGDANNEQYQTLKNLLAKKC